MSFNHKKNEGSSIQDDKKVKALLTNKAYEYLNNRDHSTLEIYKKLHQFSTKLFKSSSEDNKLDLEIIIQELISELSQKNYISNENFTNRYIDYSLKSGKGPLLIQKNLYSKGITGEIWLKEWSKYEETENEICLSVLEKWLKNKMKNNKIDEKIKVKAQRFLLSRGFHSYAVYDSLAKIT